MRKVLIIMMLAIVLLSFVVMPAVADTYFSGRVCSECGEIGVWERCSNRYYTYYPGTCSTSPRTCAVVEIYYATAEECDRGCYYLLYDGGHYEYEYHQYCFDGQEQYNCQV